MSKTDHLKEYRERIAAEKAAGTYVAPAREKKPSMRKAVNAKCRDCTYDPLGGGSAAVQIAVCTDSACPLHAVRPVTASKITRGFLEKSGISEDALCDRARILVTDGDSSEPDNETGGGSDEEEATPGHPTESCIESDSKAPAVKYEGFD